MKLDLEIVYDNINGDFQIHLSKKGFNSRQKTWECLSQPIFPWCKTPYFLFRIVTVALSFMISKGTGMLGDGLSSR